MLFLLHRNTFISTALLFVFLIPPLFVYGQPVPKKPCNDIFRAINPNEVQIDPNTKVTYAGIPNPLYVIPLAAIPLAALFGIPQTPQKINDIDVAKKCVADLNQMEEWLEHLTFSKINSYREKLESCLRASNQGVYIQPDRPIYDVRLMRDPKTGKIIEVETLVNPQTCKEYIAEKNAFINNVKAGMRAKITQCIANNKVKEYLTNPASKGYDDRFLIVPNLFE